VSRSTYAEPCLDKSHNGSDLQSEAGFWRRRLFDPAVGWWCQRVAARIDLPVEVVDVPVELGYSPAEVRVAAVRNGGC
jgi:hypothetical protein